MYIYKLRLIWSCKEFGGDKIMGSRRNGFFFREEERGEIGSFFQVAESVNKSFKGGLWW